MSTKMFFKKMCCMEKWNGSEERKKVNVSLKKNVKDEEFYEKS